jgi:hypothetical protein
MSEGVEEIVVKEENDSSLAKPEEPVPRPLDMKAPPPVAPIVTMHSSTRPRLEVTRFASGHTERRTMDGREQVVHWVIKNTVKNSFPSSISLFPLL